MHKIYTKKTVSDLINMGIFYFSQYCYYVRCDYIRRMRAEKINICRHISLLSPNSLPSPNPTTHLCTSHRPRFQGDRIHRTLGAEPFVKERKHRNTHTHTHTHTHTQKQKHKPTNNTNTNIQKPIYTSTTT